MTQAEVVRDVSEALGGYIDDDEEVRYEGSTAIIATRHDVSLTVDAGGTITLATTSGIPVHTLWRPNRYLLRFNYRRVHNASQAAKADLRSYLCIMCGRVAEEGVQAQAGTPYGGEPICRDCLDSANASLICVYEDPRPEAYLADNLMRPHISLLSNSTDCGYGNWGINWEWEGGCEARFEVRPPDGWLLLAGDVLFCGQWELRMIDFHRRIVEQLGESGIRCALVELHSGDSLSHVEWYAYVGTDAETAERRKVESVVAQAYEKAVTYSTPWR